MPATGAKSKLNGKIEKWIDLLNHLIDNYNDDERETKILADLPKEEIAKILINVALGRGYKFSFEEIKGKFLIWIEPIP